MPWSERRSIVGEVETQIFELLARRGPALTREDVLAVLASLDPPEAYLPEEFRDRFAGASATVSAAHTSWPQFPRQSIWLVKKLVPAALCTVALVVVNGVVVMIIAASEGIIPWMVTIGGLAWLNYEAVRRFRSWSATRRGGFFDDLRHSLAAWLLSKNGAAAT
jgi:hypothetical protein